MKYLPRTAESLAGLTQGYYGLLTNFYFTGAAPTLTSIDIDGVANWTEVNFTTDAQGRFDYRPESMKQQNAAGHTGVGTQADPILFSLEGLDLHSSVNFRASMTFEPDEDGGELDVRLLFNRHSGTTPSEDFEISDVALTMSQGADVEYPSEAMLSFFVGDTIDTNGIDDAGKCRFQVRSTVPGTVRMRAMTWYISQ